MTTLTYLLKSNDVRQGAASPSHSATVTAVALPPRVVSSSGPKVTGVRSGRHRVQAHVSACNE